MTDLSPVIQVPYLSVVKGRKPEQKVHKRLSDAKNAFDTPKVNSDVTNPNYPNWRQHTHGWGELYEFKDGEWQLLYSVPKPTDADIIKKKYGYTWETRPWKVEND